MTTTAPTKGERSRAKLVAAAATLLQRQGYAATGLAEIVAESGAPRGSLYFYFPGGKEELACEALRQSGASWRARIEEVVASTPDLGDAVTAVCALFARELEGSGFTLGCPIATVALEAAATSEPVRATCAEHFAGWEQAIGQRLEGVGLAPARAAELATFTLASIEGALLLAKVQRSTAPLLTVGATLRALVQLAVTAR